MEVSTGTAVTAQPDQSPDRSPDRLAVVTAPLRAGLRALRPGVLWAMALVLAVYLVLTVGVLAGGPLDRFDAAVWHWSPAAHWPALWPVLSDWVVLGQRAVCLALAVVWLGVRAVRSRDIRPLLTLGLATLLLNISVGLVKTLVGRLGPLQLGMNAGRPGATSIFADGTIFPSGHTANAVVTWVLLAMLARQHRRLWLAVAVFVSVTVGLSTIYLGTHWFSDVLAGWAAGVLVLLAVPAVLPLVDRLEQLATRLVPVLRARAGAPLGAATRMPSWTRPRPSAHARSAPQA